MRHKHRIKPGYEGGEYKEGNVVVLSPIQHAMWHFAEWQRKGNVEDRIAWKALSGLISSEEAVLEAMRLGGRKGGEWNKDPANRHLKQKRKGTKLTAEWRANLRKAHETRKDNPGDQLKKVSPQQRAKNGKKGTLMRWGFDDLFPPSKEYRTSLSETFIDYFCEYGHPTPKRVRSNSSPAARKSDSGMAE